MNNLSGKRFCKLTALKFDAIKNGHYYWLCECDCGTKKSIAYDALTGNRTKSCGCLNRSLAQQRREKFIMDLAGVRFDRLLVQKKDEEKSLSSKQTWWICLCDCGRHKSIRACSLKNRTTRSCGCLNKEIFTRNMAELPADKRGTNYLGEGVSKRNVIYNLYRTRAKNKDLEFLLSKEDFFRLIENNCYYCNSKPSQIISCGTKKDILVYNGIDRQDNAVGYIKENCVSCCKYCNTAKNDRQLNEFQLWAKNLYENMILKN